MQFVDKLIIGAGLYGLYSALYCARKGQTVIVLEYDSAPFKRATHINQARVHQGYHYPRSISTAMKSAGYFERFNIDYGFCINNEFEQIYATSSCYSYTDKEQFARFCKWADIPCEEVNTSKYFNAGMCDGAFKTREYTYDAIMLKDFFIAEISKYKNANVICGVRIKKIQNDGTSYFINTEDGNIYKTRFLLNATYASTNQILEKAGMQKYKVKYELCEIILCETNEKLRRIGITVMDGPFFSMMPFGKTGYHSLTSVTFTPHMTSYNECPTFSCQDKSNGFCSAEQLGNCNDCIERPETAFPYMSGLARKYILDEYSFKYNQSLFSMKPILVSSEIDDSRPTVITRHSTDPTFVSVLSGKINTVYDLNEVLDDE